MISAHRQTRLTFALGFLIALAVLLSYFFVYLFEPFAEFWNAFMLDGLTTLAALACAVSVVLVLQCYEKDEPLHRVWANFSIALWLWFLAELVWMYFDLFIEEAPIFSAADIFWLTGYIFFSFALLAQFKVVYKNFSRARLILLATWLAVVVLAIATVFILINVRFIEPEKLFEKFIIYFYPYADFAIAFFAIVLVRRFRGGSIARPWLGMLGFVLSDTLYGIATELGEYGWLNSDAGYFRLVIDSIYIFAYLIMGWGLLSQFTLLKFGTGMFLSDRQITQPIKPVEK